MMFNLMVYADALAEEIQTAEQLENTTHHWADRVATALLANPGGVVAMLVADAERRGAEKARATADYFNPWRP